MKRQHKLSLEKISHFQCGLCFKWWSIGDAPKKDSWYCPWCGEKSKVKNKENEKRANK